MYPFYYDVLAGARVGAMGVVGAIDGGGGESGGLEKGRSWGRSPSGVVVGARIFQGVLF